MMRSAPLRPPSRPPGQGDSRPSRDPRSFPDGATEFANRLDSGTRGDLKLALGLDFDLRTGFSYALYRPDWPLDVRSNFVALGHWNFFLGPVDSEAEQFARLYDFLAALRPDLIAYQEPPPTSSEPVDNADLGILARQARRAARFPAGLRDAVCLWAERRGVVCRSYATPEIRQRATGKQAASKVEMIVAANELFGVRLLVACHETSAVDHAASAAVAMLMGMEDLGRQPGGGR